MQNIITDVNNGLINNFDDSYTMNYNQNDKTEIHGTPIQRFYAGQSIFITGGTGFLGKILIEKLLRSCSDISTIYVLIRSKKDRSPKTRLDEILETPLYDRLRKEMPKFSNKIVPVIGDLNVENLGLSEDDKNLLMREVSIIFHIAATVRFDEKISISTKVNVSATAYILRIAKCMPNLKSFVHVSTLFANCHVKHIEESFYTYSINHKDLITLTGVLPENVVDETMAKITSQWPNTYTCTKAIAEILVKDEGGDLPIGIFRPAIVTSTAFEPITGWVDNLYGPMGLTVSAALGIMRYMLCNTELSTNFVPADFTVNALIVSAWDIFNYPYRRGKDMLIYNYVSTNDAPFTWEEYKDKTAIVCEMYPFSNMMWFPMMIMFRRKISYTLSIWFGHLLPALLVDAIRICMGLQPRMWKIYQKIHKLVGALVPFTTTKWSFATDNVQEMWDRLDEKDQQLFQFSMKRFNWSNYIVGFVKGIRLYLMNENDSTLEINRIRYKRLYCLHQILKTMFVFAILWIIWSILVKIMA